MIIIDLIAVISEYRGKNIGASMINFAYKNIHSKKLLLVLKLVIYLRSDCIKT